MILLPLMISVGGTSSCAEHSSVSSSASAISTSAVLLQSLKSTCPKLKRSDFNAPTTNDYLPINEIPTGRELVSTSP